MLYVSDNLRNFSELSLPAKSQAGASSFTGECLKTDLRPPFGFTSPPLAETAESSVCEILRSSALILIAALPSLS